MCDTTCHSISKSLHYSVLTWHYHLAVHVDFGMLKTDNAHLSVPRRGSNFFSAISNAAHSLPGTELLCDCIAIA